MSTDLSVMSLDEINQQRTWLLRESRVLERELFRRAGWKVPESVSVSPPRSVRMALSYPTEVPTAEVLKLLKIIRSPDRLAHRVDAIHLAIHIELYAAYMAVGQPPEAGAPLVTRALPEAEPNAEFEAAIDELSAELPAAPEDRAVFGAPGDRWQFLLQLALKVLPLFL